MIVGLVLQIVLIFCWFLELIFWTFVFGRLILRLFGGGGGFGGGFGTLVIRYWFWRQ